MAHQLAEDADTSTIAATDTITSTAKENKTVKKRRRKNSCSSEVSDASDHTSTMAAEELEVTLPAATPVENVPIENVNRILLPTNHPFRRSTKKSTTTATACTTINNNNESMIKEGTSTSSTLTSSSLSYPPIIMSNKVHSVVVGSPPTMATNATNTAATPRRDRSGSKCTVGDCDKPSRQGGRCDAHGAKRTQCKQPGCTVHAKMAGLCSRHGGRKQCEFEDCDKVARLGRRCYRHRVLTEEQKAETERRIAEKEKIRDDKIAETERRRAEKEKMQEQKVSQCNTHYCSECLCIICIILQSVLYSNPYYIIFFCFYCCCCYCFQETRSRGLEGSRQPNKTKQGRHHTFHW